MRKGRAKKNMMTEAQCAPWSELFLQKLSSADFLSQSGLTPAEKVAAYLLLGFECLVEPLKTGSRLPADPFLQIAETSPLKPWASNIFRGIPLSVNRSLISWHLGHYPLQLFFRVLETEEVLRLQSKGERCVSCLLEPDILSKYILQERDPLSFVMHDLIHADHFFHNPDSRQVQTGFSRLSERLWHSNEIQSLRARDPEFQKNFDYICTDMNSHGVHLLKSLKVVLSQGLEGLQGKVEETLPSLLLKAGWSEVAIENFLKLNSPEESENEYQMLLEFLGSQKAPPPARIKNTVVSCFGSESPFASFPGSG